MLSLSAGAKGAILNLNLPERPEEMVGLLASTEEAGEREHSVPPPSPRWKVAPADGASVLGGPRSRRRERAPKRGASEQSTDGWRG